MPRARRARLLGHKSCDPRVILFYLHSRRVNEAAFYLHAELPHTVRFLERIKPLIDHPLDITRAKLLD